MIKKLPKEFLTVISSNNGLKMYLSNLAKGREMTPRSWLYEDKDPQEVLATWMKTLSTLEKGDNLMREVFHFDISQLEKWGPQGGIDPISDLLEEVVMPTFLRGDSPRPKVFSSTQWIRAVDNVAKQFVQRNGIRGLRPASYNNVVADMRARDTLESNSGWPDFARRNKPGVLSAAVQAASDGEWLNYPAIALFRNYNKKTRLVWMFPESTNINEGSFCQPIQSAIVNKQVPFYTPWLGFNYVQKQITHAYNSGHFLAASDFSKTDEHFTLNTTMEAYYVLAQAFQQAHIEDLKVSLQRMHSIPLIIGDDEMIVGKHGVASGSTWTNFIETIFDDIFQEYVAISTNGNTQGLCAIGDDMCWMSAIYDDALADKLNTYGEEVGQLLNAEKVTNKRDSVKFLQRLFQRGYRRSDGVVRGVYSTIRALKSSIYPERFHKPSSWSEDMFCARQYMILENCVDHPLFEDFVKFIVHGQRGLIPFAKKGAAELDVITRKTKLIPGFNPTYNQEKRGSSLANFEAIRIASSL